MNSQIPLLTDIIEPGIPEKAGLYDHINKTGIHLMTTDEEALSHEIEKAIEAALPAVKRQLHQQILSALIKK